LGPAVAFLVSGPGLDILPIVFTFQILGVSLGTARLIGLLALSVVTGMLMAFIFRKEEMETEITGTAAVPDSLHEKKWWVQVILFGLLIAVMVLATSREWLAAGISSVALVIFFLRFFDRDDFLAWMSATLEFVKRILPWVLVGLVGALLIVVFLPSGVIANLVGGNSIFSCFTASLSGSILYLCPPSEILYTKAFTDLGMGHGPSLSFILTAPAVSLPSMVVLFKIIGAKKTVTYIGLLIALTTLAGFIFGLVRG
jgi:uncharacterized protein